MTDTQTLITTLMMVSFILTVVCLFSFGILIWFRKAVIDRIKIKKLMKFGYVKGELIRHDKTRISVVQIPDKETKSIKFPGVEGLYTIDNASVILTDRTIPTYVWKEGETSPINFESDHIDSKITCPHCDKETIVKVEKPKSIPADVLDNIIMKIKTLAQFIGLNNILKTIIILIVLAIAGGVISAFLIHDFKKRIAEILAPTIFNQCKLAVLEAVKPVV